MGLATRPVLRQWIRERTGEGTYIKKSVPADYKGRVVRALMAGNGKMDHPTDLFALSIISGFSQRSTIESTIDIDVVLAPGALWVDRVAAFVRAHELRVAIAAQDVSVVGVAGGAFTGEISAEQCYAAGARFAILGHSERRSGAVFQGQLPGETPQMVAQKVEAALRGRLIPIVCVGETLEERQGGNLEAVIGTQLMPVLTVNPSLFKSKKGVIAYEPVWAIGTGVTAKPEDAEAACFYIRELLHQHVSPEAALNTRILYGGSVKPDNVDALMSMPNIDGGLVGGAFLQPISALQLISFGLSA